MLDNKVHNYIAEVLNNMPSDWINLTTHRLDIYNEELAKTQFLEGFDQLFQENKSDLNLLEQLPTAYDYIRLGHPLSSILEWSIAKLNHSEPERIISFSSTTMPIMAVLRYNLLSGIKTRIVYNNDLPTSFDQAIIEMVYGYHFELKKIQQNEEISSFDGITIVISKSDDICHFDVSQNTDFIVNYKDKTGSILFINGAVNKKYISEIQHVRRRESIAMTPADSLMVLKHMVGETDFTNSVSKISQKKTILSDTIKNITGVATEPVIGSSGLSIQYAIVMGLIHDALITHKGKEIKLVIPPNCYGGTNDQARRVAACINNIEIVDLPVDGGNDMVQGIETVLDDIAELDAVPYIIAEIPTNPRVEVPNLQLLQNALSKTRRTPTGEIAIPPVFILDQTFCPNVEFLGDGKILSPVKTIAYVSGSKFPSGGKVTAGYCVANNKAKALMDKIDLHIKLCDNEATDFQIEVLSDQMPSMNKRIQKAYKNTREFVNFIQKTLPEAKINFVSEELASKDITPSVFSLDLPTHGKTVEEREINKRKLNLKLINLMINEIPNESKYCVSYGQLKGCYWTIPATSTQGTTREDDKDYIVRASVSPDLDIELHKRIFKEFVESEY